MILASINPLAVNPRRVRILTGCRGKPATNKHRMNPELSNFAARLRELISNRQSAIGNSQFSELALELFALQFKHNSAYRKICEARKLTPQSVGHWTQIPAVPTAAFKELELTSLAPDERAAVFHSSGTTEQKPSRHFHCAESLVVYETSLWTWFEQNVLWSADGSSAGVGVQALACASAADKLKLELQRGRAVPIPLFLTPPPASVPHSSLVHMFETVQAKLGGARTVAVCQDPASRSSFFGKLDSDGAWTLDFGAVMNALSPIRQTPSARPLLLLGTAFSFVHLLDYLVERDLRVELPAGSRVMETGGYKNRSRSMPKAELHALITDRLGVPRENILCEYGMSELSSQAYATGAPASSRRVPANVANELAGRMPALQDNFHFPPWARAQIISPETGREVAEGEPGIIRILDLVNVFSVAAIQTEDLGIRRGDGFELIGRAQLAEPRGCSLMTA
jgi:hypothetical protein